MKSALKFLADENIHSAVVEFLQSKSFDVIDVFSLNLQLKPDKEILLKAKALNRIILTHDSDFGQIIFKEHIDFNGVILLQPGHIQPQFTIQTLNAIINANLTLIEPFILVAEQKEHTIKLRIRNNITHQS